jgi:hypothetical protein
MLQAAKATKRALRWLATACHKMDKLVCHLATTSLKVGVARRWIDFKTDPAAIGSSPKINSGEVQSKRMA